MRSADPEPSEELPSRFSRPLCCEGENSRLWSPSRTAQRMLSLPLQQEEVIFSYWILFRLCRSCPLFLLLSRKEPVLEEKQVQSSAGDAAVGKVEDRSEEFERTAGNPWHPVRECSVYNRKIEHIHHLSEHERGVTASE